ncbi:MerR family transcriptional regulator [Gordonibacter sp. An230]|uniref:MerR family transcriptional regulator n=1 Tax=Gordonibacter sp. An230 TaxID=1965592 RepID=UPI000B39530E|nr:MerR family transcriptional regulator [Gordonibacter sp. An230]OUO87774.1 MerR family transcriptional regulator [Gordonibacter sp. An230]
MDEPRLYDIKDAARYLEVAPSTLRYWESQGLVRARRNRGNDYRQYSLHDLIEASEIAFYRKLGVPVKELEGYRALSARGLDEALARTESDIEHRIAQLEGTRARLSRQRALNAEAARLARQGMRAKAPAIVRLEAIDYNDAGPWRLLVEEPWRYGVLVDAAHPDEVLEAVADEENGDRAGTRARDGEAEALWLRSPAHTARTCRECLLKVAPASGESNVRELLSEAREEGIDPVLVVGSYLLTATDDAGRWDLHRAWVVGDPSA